MKSKQNFILKLLFLMIISLSFTSVKSENTFKSNNSIVNLDLDKKHNVQVRCAATTKKGFSCSRNARSGENYCTQHTKQKNPNIRYRGGCQGIAKSTGVQCKRKARKGDNYCASHG
jgi:hypothetical protein